MKKSAEVKMSLTVIGLGNIGSFLALLLARMLWIARLNLVDHDFFQAKNIVSQSILPADVGKPKAEVIAEKLRAINPKLQVTPFVARVEDVPPGLLRCDCMVVCVDTKAARRAVNEIAWGLGIPWIDGGVNAEQGLYSRVSTYIPAEDSPCIECGFSERDYESMQEVHPCDRNGASPGAVPTNAPACLGALTASLQAIECQKLLLNDRENLAAGRHVVLDAKSHSLTVSRIIRYSGCRFSHKTWDLQKLSLPPGEETFGGLRALGKKVLGGNGSLAVSVRSRQFVRKLKCFQCGGEKDTVQLVSMEPTAGDACLVCGNGMAPYGLGVKSFLLLENSDIQLLNTPLSSAGLRTGMILRLYDNMGMEKHYEIQ